MPGSDPVAQTLDVPGARLYYERQGAGPLLVMIGSPMDSTGFAGLARALVGRYTVVTYDPRGIGKSTREDPTQDVTPEQQADDLHRLLSALGGEPAHVFGSSGGAVVGLALVTAHSGQVRTLVAHEPPVIELLPDRDQVRAQIQDIYDTYRAEGAETAMAKFMAHAGLGQGSRPGARRAALGTLTRAAGGDARRHRGIPGPSDPPDHAVPARRRGPASDVGPHRGRRRGHLGGTARPPRRRGPCGPARHARGRIPRRPRRVRDPARAVRPGLGSGAHPADLTATRRTPSGGANPRG